LCIHLSYSYWQLYATERCMADSLAQTTHRLEQLLEQILRENDRAKRDALAAEIWRILEEREQLRKQSSTSAK
jgi:predicted MarR family transcription regulator